jgi:hypothetical protein
MNYIRIILVIVSLATATSCLAEEEWVYEFTPYIWLAGINGEVATIPGAPSAPIDVPVSEALEDTKIALTFSLDARKNGHGLFMDFLYGDVRSTEERVPPPIDLLMQSTSKTLIWTMAYEYELIRTDNGLLDFVIGGRYWDIDTMLEFRGGLGILDGMTVRHSESWVDPVVALKGYTKIGGSRCYMSGAAALGGFDVGSDLFYDLNLNFGYQWTPRIGTAVGYRYFDVDYEKNEFLYDVAQEGWILSATFHF